MFEDCWGEAIFEQEVHRAAQKARKGVKRPAASSSMEARLAAAPRLAANRNKKKNGGWK